jgi:fumarylacetoacetate (FAA) hydrolase
MNSKVYEVPCKEGHTGKSWNLPMKCWVNGVQVSRRKYVSDMDWTFAEIIERCAYGVDIHPGDVIGSGTVGTGCFLELNGTGKLSDPNYTEQWLQEGRHRRNGDRTPGKIAEYTRCRGF